MKTFLTALAFFVAANSYSAETKSAAMGTQLDDLIRGEMSAVRVYDQVLEKVTNTAEVTKLKAIRMDHQNAVATLKRYASSDVREDTQTVGPWGTFTKAWTGTAKLMGNETAIKALAQGEEHGISEYKEALNDDAVSKDLKNLIKTNLLPKQEAHLKSLNALL